MGRGKIEIAKIENANSRQVTFSKRGGGLMKKAYELSVLCDAEVAVIAYSSAGKLLEFSSSSMEQTLARYNKCVESSEKSAVEHEVPKEVREVECLKQELADLELKNMQLLGKELSGLGLKELLQLEQLMIEGLLSLKDKSEELLLEQLDLSRQKELKARMEIATLRRKLQSFLPPNELPDPVSGYLEHEVPRNEYEVPRKYSPVKHAFSSQDTECQTEAEKGELMTTLYLGPPPDNIQRKRKTLERETETLSGTSDSQIER